MDEESRFQGTALYISARWPTFLLRYGGSALLALLMILLGISRGWWGLVALGLALLLLAGYFFGTALWAAYHLFDLPGQRPADLFYHLGSVTPTSRVVYVGMGPRRTPRQLSRRLTAGRVTALDVYNPRLAPDGALARERQMISPGPPDPRFRSLEATIQLLPLPDRSTNLVVVEGALGALAQHGDRELLLAEIYRILEPEGRMVIAQTVRSRAAWLVWGSTAWQQFPPAFWRRQLSNAGFNFVKEQAVEELLYYFVVERPAPGEMEQLTLDLGI